MTKPQLPGLISCPHLPTRSSHRRRNPLNVASILLSTVVALSLSLLTLKGCPIRGHYTLNRAIPVPRILVGRMLILVGECTGRHFETVRVLCNKTTILFQFLLGGLYNLGMKNLSTYKNRIFGDFWHFLYFWHFLLR